jgi:hypothetical protein
MRNRQPVYSVDVWSHKYGASAKVKFKNFSKKREKGSEQNENN